MTEVRLPKWGATMQEATLLEWHVEVGDKVKAGDVLAEVETEKVDAEIESPADGRIAEILVAAGDTVEPGTVLARIEDQ